MPLRNRNDAAELDQRLKTFFAASPGQRSQVLRQIFVEKLDFASMSGAVSLARVPAMVSLPESAERIASHDGVQVAFVALTTADSDRVRKAEASTAARLINDTLKGDLLLLMMNTSGSQLHVIWPSFAGTTPTLRRMVVERDLPRRTVVQQLSNLYWDYTDSRDLRGALERAFNVEAVTKQFFDEYKRIFDNAMPLVKGFGSSAEELESKRVFVQTLFNRLMFICFISRKGWLRLQGDNDYLNALWKDYESNQNGKKNFYNDRLSPLFFAGLNNPQSRDLNKNNPVLYALIGDVPFLNGGLFDEAADEKRSGVEVSDKAIKPILTELFDRFNFTVMESTPFDIEVAVDPEMLGKVFEELVTGRHESGSYYTPKPVVSFMAREALKGYLATACPAESRTAIERFVDGHNPEGLRDAEAVLAALKRVRVCDPACGSGAYLLGMLHELLDLRQALFATRRLDYRTVFDRKLEIIENSLYGVDIDPFAVNITMLRLWLSLVVDYDGKVEDLPPLPNLDFKIETGDSLTAPSPQTTEKQDFRDEFVRRFQEKKAAYMRANGSQKTDLRKEIEDIRAEIAQWTRGEAAVVGFDWAVEFAEVFADGGFDVVIANPPYVSSDSMGPTKDVLRAAYSNATTGRSDLYTFFYVRGFQLIKSGGTHVFVCSNTWLDSQFGIPLINWLLLNTKMELVLDSELERQFSTAAVNTIISVISKQQPSSDNLITFATLIGPFEQSVVELRLIHQGNTANSIRAMKKTYEELSSEMKIFLPLDTSPKWGGRFLRAPEVYGIVTAALSQQGKTLSEYAKGERYLNTGGADGFFILNEVVQISPGLVEVTTRSKEGAEWGYPRFRIEEEFLRPGVKGAGSNTLIFQEPDCWVLSIPEDTKISRFQVREYIKWGEKAGFNKRSVTRTQIPWWRPPLQARRGAPILWGRTHGDFHRVFFNPRLMITVRFFRLHPIIGIDPKILWALLNSTIYALLKEIHGRRGLGYGGLETGLVDILPLPVPMLTPELSERLVEFIEPISNRKTKPLASEIGMADRQELDKAILQAIDLPSSLLDEIYESTVHLISARVTKAGNVAVKK